MVWIGDHLLHVGPEARLLVCCRKSRSRRLLDLEQDNGDGKKHDAGTHDEG